MGIADSGDARELLQITPTQIAFVADQVGEATAEFANRLRDVDGEVTTLLGSGWRGTPGSQFHDAFVEWHAGASKVVDGMTELVAALRTAAQNFNNADQPR
ncbi:WXG100 family type VII secretion target [Mycobacterium sp.]|uniref:WXG100 family type VII secretion target n=1 Tax=Mycobacterium sp. TaxID=1785 RepID=UPI000CC27BB7|nr:WXG100 family type VII secretion target [Mycobacterium sp.]PJE01324.1 MAG: hypothetical protein CK428_31430 [Mycobacterium sp.]